MGKIIILGTANAIPAEGHENTHLFIRHGERIILVDCAANPVPHLSKAGVDINHVYDLILTHFHPDHVSGVPLLLMDMWLMGRKQDLTIYGLEHTLSRLQTLMDLYEWKTWPNFYPVHFKIQPEYELAPLIEENDVRIFSSPVKHLLPTIGIRVEFSEKGSSAAYSSDTEPTDVVVRLAQGVDVLIHEATGASLGHSSAGQAGEIAQKARAKSLYLVHYPTQASIDDLIRQAKTTYTGPVWVAKDFMEIEIGKSR